MDDRRPGALSFDCYGTLIDWETGLLDVLAPWAGPIPRDRLLESFATHETRVEQDDPRAAYPDVLAETLRRMGAELGVPVGADDAERLGASVGDWPPFPDSGEALRRLQSRYALAILSNVDRASFARTERALGVRFDLVVTAEEVGAYKPALDGFHMLFDRLAGQGIERGGLLHVAQSLYHDHVPARKLGLPSVWIDRRGGEAGGATPGGVSAADVPDRRYPSMAAFAEAMLDD